MESGGADAARTFRDSHNCRGEPVAQFVTVTAEEARLVCSSAVSQQLWPIWPDGSQQALDHAGADRRPLQQT